MTKEEAWKIINNKKDDNNHYGMFFNLISGLPEGFKKSLEDQLVNMVIMGSAMGKSLGSVEPNSPEYNKMERRLVEISQKTRIQIEKDFKKSKEDIKQREKDAK